MTQKYSPNAGLMSSQGWANITGQISLVCSIDFTCAQMITTAIAVASDGEMILGLGATYGILLAILFTHGLVCSAATSIIARLNLFYVLINGEYSSSPAQSFDPSFHAVGTTIAAIIALLVVSGDNKVSTKVAFTLYENNSGWSNSVLISHSICNSHMIQLRWLGFPFCLYGTNVDPHWVLVQPH